MKGFFAVATLLHISGSLLFAQDETEIAKEKEAVRGLIERTYINVLYHGGDVAKLAEGFHPEFNMYYYYQKKVQKRSLQEWTNRLKEVRSRNVANNAVKKKQQRSHEFRFIDVTGYTGIAKFDIFFDGKLKYTDYLTLYKTDDEGWKVITKQFTTHY